MRVRVGTAGLPHAAKNKGYLRGLKLLKCLGLDALEIEFVYGIDMSEGEAREVRELARRLDILLSVHAPYFINFCSEEIEKRERSVDRLVKTLEIADVLGARYVVIHAAHYMSYGPTRCYELVKYYIDKVLKLRDWKAKIAIETMAKDTQFGTLEEVVKICREFGTERVVPCIDWAHLYIRYRGNIDFRKVLEILVTELELRELHCHFTGIRDLEDEHEPVDTGKPSLEALADALVAYRDVLSEVSIICESPLLEKDALKIKRIINDKLR